MRVEDGPIRRKRTKKDNSVSPYSSSNFSVKCTWAVPFDCAFCF